ncbi:MAG: murein transglycosylase [Bacteroidia bacterium]|nr:MAG: murein transglycosylase [Bacteroidia bacterium]
MHFCNDTLPLDNIEVKHSIQKEFYEKGLIKNKASVMLLISRCNRWFPIIEPILKKYQLPEDIKYVAIIESHLSNVTSPMGAKGFWQLLPSTAQTYGLEVNEYVDERLDVEKSTYAACKYFLQAYQELKNWTLVAAAYNYGINGIKFQLEKQNTQSYHQLQLNKETKEFVYRIIAYKTLLNYPELFGIKRKIKPSFVPKLKSIKIDSSITNLKYLAKHLQCPLLLLKAFNPWLLSESLPNPEKKVYVFKYPANTKLDYSAYISDLLGYNYNTNETNSSKNNQKDSSITKDSSNLPLSTHPSISE